MHQICTESYCVLDIVPGMGGSSGDIFKKSGGSCDVYNLGGVDRQ